MKISKLYKKILNFCDFVDKEIIMMLVMGLLISFFAVPKYGSIAISLMIYIIYFLFVRLRYKSKISNYATSCAFIVILIAFYTLPPHVTIGEKKFNEYLKRKSTISISSSVGIENNKSGF